MRLRRYIMVALLTFAFALLLRQILPRPQSPVQTPPRQPENSTNIAPNEVVHLPTYLNAAPQPGAPAGATNNLTPSSSNQPATAAVTAETDTNPPDNNPNLTGPAVVSGRPVKPPWTPPPTNPPPFNLGTTSAPVLAPPARNLPDAHETP